MLKRFFKSKNGQMSEAFITIFFITFSGGLQDAYTYIVRGGTFANAQTGNIVLMSMHLMDGNPGGFLKYLMPVTAFALGVITAEQIGSLRNKFVYLHWRQLVLLIEILLLFLVAFIPADFNELANSIVSFTCAMQVETFRKIDSHVFASTMCIGNLRSAGDALSKWARTGEKVHLKTSLKYFAVIVSFASGAAIGGVLAEYLSYKLILVSCMFLFTGFVIMFLNGEPV